MAAAKYGVATQMGNQGYSQRGARECCEIIWHGDIGDVTEVHAWTNRPARTGRRVRTSCRRKRPSRRRSIGKRGWAAAGAAPVQPRVCAAQLARVPRFRLRRDRRHGLPHPGHAQHGDAARPRPPASSASSWRARRSTRSRTAPSIRFDFPARGAHAARQGLLVRPADGAVPKFDGVPEGELIGDKDINGSLFIGDKGMVTTGCYGERYAAGAGGEDEGLQDAAAGALARSRTGEDGSAATTATGFAPARAASRRAPTSASRARSCSGCCSA